jgi:Na+-transporting NADH:ubiquinone oxidoreductase subunit E
MTGLMAMAFQGFTGIKLATPTGKSTEAVAANIAPLSQKETQWSEPK